MSFTLFEVIFLLVAFLKLLELNKVPALKMDIQCSGRFCPFHVITNMAPVLVGVKLFW